MQTRQMDEQTKSIRVNTATYINDVCKMVAEQFRMEDSPELGIWFDGNGILEESYYLDRRQTLRYYDVVNLDVFFYKSRMRPLRVELMDGARKVVMVDEAVLLKDIVELVCSKQNISNPEEFSFQLSLTEDQQKEEEARKKAIEKQKKKMGLSTTFSGASVKSDNPDDLWLPSDKTLAQCSVLPEYSLLLKKRFFFYDATVDTSDPVTLNLLYQQYIADIVDESLPVARDEAVMFAALAAQITLGDHDPDKHKPKKVNISQWLPSEYDDKKTYKEVLREHSKLRGQKADSARFRFIQLARSLDTFGISIFKVQEPIRDKKTGKAKKKFQPVYLGISKSHLYRFDPETKKSLSKPFLLTQLRRWAPTETSLTLDFGDHDSEYYTVLTDEGRAIASLISGYIDIILSQRRDRARDLDDGAQQAVEEEMITSQRAHGVSSSSGSNFHKIQMSSASTVGMVGGNRLSSARGSSNISVRKLDKAMQLSLSNLASSDRPLMPYSGDDIVGDTDRERKVNLQAARDYLDQVLSDISNTSGDIVSAAGVSSSERLRKYDLLESADHLVALSDDLKSILNSKALKDSGLDELADGVSQSLVALLQAADLAAKDAATGNAGNSLADLLKAAGDVSLAIQGMVKSKPIEGVDLASLLAAASDLNGAIEKLIGAPVGHGTTDPNLKKSIEDASAAVADYGRQMVAMAALATASDDSGIKKLRLQGLVLEDSINALIAAAKIDGVDPMDMNLLLRLASDISGALDKLRAATNADKDATATPPVVAVATLVESERASVRASSALDALDDVDENDQAAVDAARAEALAALAPFVAGDAASGSPFSLATLQDVDGFDVNTLGSLMSAASSLSSALASLTGELNPDSLSASQDKMGAALTALKKESRKCKIVAARGVADEAARIIPLAKRDAENERSEVVKGELMASCNALTTSLASLKTAMGAFEASRSDADLDAVVRAALDVGHKSASLDNRLKQREALLLLSVQAKKATLAASDVRGVLSSVDSAKDADTSRSAKRAAVSMSKKNGALGDAALFYEAEPHTRESQWALLDAVASTLPAYAEVSMNVFALKSSGFHNPGDEFLLVKAGKEMDERVAALVRAFNAAKASNWLYDVSTSLEKLNALKGEVTKAIADLSKGTFGVAEEDLDADSRSSLETSARRSATDGIASTIEASSSLAATLQLLVNDSPSAASSVVASEADDTVSAVLKLLALGEGKKGKHVRTALDAAAELIEALICEVELTQEAGEAAENRYDPPSAEDVSAAHAAAVEAALALKATLPGRRGTAEALAAIRGSSRPVLAMAVPGDAEADAAGIAAARAAAADADEDEDGDGADGSGGAGAGPVEHEYEYYEVEVVVPAKPVPPAKPAAAADPNVVPPPWKAFYDDGHARYYYVNQDTQETTWIQPPMPAPPPIPSKPTIMKQKKKRRVDAASSSSSKKGGALKKTKMASPVVVASAQARASATAVEPVPATAEDLNMRLDEDLADLLAPRAVALSAALQGVRLGASKSGGELDAAASKVARAYPAFVEAVMVSLEAMPESSSRRVNGARAAKAVTRLAAASVAAAEAVNADRGDADAALALEQTSTMADAQLRALMSALIGDDARGLDDFASMLADVAAKEKEMAQMRKVLQSAEASSSEGSAQVDALMSEVESLNGKLKEAKTRAAAAEAERAALQEKADGETKQLIEGYQHEIEVLKERIAELEALVAQLRAELAEKEGLSHAQLEEAQAERNEARNEVRRLKQELEDERAARARLEELAPELKAQLEAMQAQLEAEKMAFKKKLAEQADYPLEGADVRLVEFVSMTLANDPHVASLLPISARAMSVATACMDGVLLCKLLNAMVPGTIDERVIKLRVSDEEDVKQNMQLVLMSAKGVGCPVIGVKAKDLYTGQVPKILALMWDLVKVGLLAKVNVVRHPELFSLQSRDEEMASFSRLPPETLLLRWINHHATAGGAPAVTNFGGDLSDGVALTHLLAQLEPTLGLGPLGQTDPTGRAAAVIENAGTLTGARWVEPSDVVDGNAKLNLFFVASLFSARTGLEMSPELEALVGDVDPMDVEGTREERAFKLWIKSMDIDTDVYDLSADLKSGVALLELEDKVEEGVVSWERVNKAKDGKKLHVMKLIENCNLACSVARHMGLVIVGIDGNDIATGASLKLSLAILWQLMRAHVLKVIANLSYGGRPVSDVDVLNWAIAKVRASGKSANISSFQDKSLSNGLFFVDLLASLNSRAIDYSYVTAGITEEEKLENASYVLGVARRLNCTHFLVPEDIVEVNAKMILAFTGSLMEASARASK